MAGHVVWNQARADAQIKAWAIKQLTACAVVVQNHARELVSGAGTGTRTVDIRSRLRAARAGRADVAAGRVRRSVTVTGTGKRPRESYLNVEGKQVRVSYKAGKSYYHNIGGKPVKRTQYTAQYHVDTGTGWRKIRKPKRYYRRGPGGGPQAHYGF